MKIIHFIYDSVGNPWLGGGGAYRTQELYKILSQKHEVIIISGNFPGAENNIDGVKYKRLGWAKSYLISRFTFIVMVYLYLPFLSADIYVEDLGPLPLGAPIFKKNVIASVQFVPNSGFVKKRGVLGKFSRYFFNSMLKLYKRFIVVSQFTLEYVKEYNHKANIVVVENGVPDNPSGVIKGQYVLYLGRIDVIGKGLDLLLSSLVKIKKTHIDFDTKFKIAGSGEKKELNKLYELIEKNKLTDEVDVLGFVDGSEKYNLINNSKFLVLPSRNETSSLVALEGFSFGKPIIGSNVGGLGGIILESGAGLTFKVDSVDDLKDKILELSSDDNLLDKFIDKAKAYAESRSWSKVAENYSQALNRNLHESI